METLIWLSGLAAGVAISAGVAIIAVIAVVQDHQRRKRQLETIEMLHEVVETHRGDDLYLQQEILTWDEVQERLKEGTSMGIQMDYREIRRRIGG